ncbi:unnamed protein product [Haemonchus placei]|uniref:Nudix_hydro domain-containing protein n=1 Tax=Haemonchus placei TaxID=6290 RepID=A0A0N4WUE8_HAEPC|nr:unnamed protein product [Haemonchus placei]
MVLPYTVNEEYDDAVMTTSFLPREMVVDSRFATEIIETFNAWKERKLNAAKVYISSQDSHVVPHLAKLGFDFAHAAKGEMAMTCWLSDKPPRLPPQLLWRFPGGPPKHCENLLMTAERKVKEKTGVVAEGDAIISLGQKLRTKYAGSCAFFFVCLMKNVRNTNVGGVEIASDVIVDVRDEINSMLSHEFDNHHRNVWRAYLKSLDDITSKMFHFTLL